MTEPLGAAGRLRNLARGIGERAGAPVDAAGLAAFRFLFGIMTAFGATRFLWNGWVESIYLEPAFHFKYWGFEWVRAWPGLGMHLHFVWLTVLSLLVAFGLFYRFAIIAFLVAFTYAELVDVTVYLNHYYLVSLLGLLLCFLPANAVWSLDVLRRPELRRPHVPALCTWVLRFQVGTVYFFAGVAKLGSDWLWGAQPLNIWLGSHGDFPLLGPLFGEPVVAYAMGWTGLLFDTTIALWLSLRRTRPVAYAAVVLFHSVTGALFPIGLFPLIMATSALVFFPADWPRTALSAVVRLLPGHEPRARAHGPSAAAPSRFRIGKVWAFAVIGYVAVQLLVPLRHHLYGGNVLWHEQGMRWSWKVMVREKNGAVTFVARSPSMGRVLHVPPRRYLTSLQEREMSTQPDLILQLAHRVRDDLRARGMHDVQVYADAVVSLNGRPAARLVDPGVDLARVKDGVAPFGWVLPEPSAPPPRLRSRSRTASVSGVRGSSS